MRATVDVSHLRERFGLFTIFVLSDAIGAVEGGITGRTWTVVATTATAALGFGLAIALWRIYFDRSPRAPDRRRRQ